eukprot:1147424-Pelagomonas_calceolata.AAC.5
MNGFIHSTPDSHPQTLSRGKQHPQRTPYRVLASRGELNHRNKEQCNVSGHRKAYWSLVAVTKWAEKSSSTHHTLEPSQTANAMMCRNEMSLLGRKVVLDMAAVVEMRGTSKRACAMVGNIAGVCQYP